MALSHQLTEEMDLLYQGHVKMYRDREPEQNSSKGKKVIYTKIG